MQVRHIRGGGIAGKRSWGRRRAWRRSAPGCPRPAGRCGAVAARGRRLRRLRLGADHARRQPARHSDRPPRAERPARPRQSAARPPRRADRHRLRDASAALPQGAEAQGGPHRHAGAAGVRPAARPRLPAAGGDRADPPSGPRRQPGRARLRRGGAGGGRPAERPAALAPGHQPAVPAGSAERASRKPTAASASVSSWRPSSTTSRSGWPRPTC